MTTNKPRKQRIGILGGTFNPVHLGHLLVAQAACETGRLDKVKFVPAAVPPHKGTGSLVTARHRLAMLQRAVDGDPRFEVDDIEIQRGGRSYSVDTLRALHRSEPAANYFFVIGSDSLAELHLWHDISNLARLCRFSCRGASRIRPGPAGCRAGDSLPVGARSFGHHLVTRHPPSLSSRSVNPISCAGAGVPLH